MNQPMTIDLLILATLAEGKPVTAAEIAGRWGEDRVRVGAFLERFRRQGLASPRPGQAARKGGAGWTGHRRKIAAYIAARNAEARAPARNGGNEANPREVSPIFGRYPGMNNSADRDPHPERPMKIADYPKSLPRMEQYTAGEVAILYGVSHRTACKMIDTGAIEGFTVPGSRERRVLHSAIERHVEANPQYEYVLAKVTEPTPAS